MISGTPEDTLPINIAMALTLPAGYRQIMNFLICRGLF